MDDLIDVKNLIHEIRGHKVMLDSDLAKLYGVETRILNQAVKRNINRFPTNFMFQLTKEEFVFLISQFVISKKGNRGGRQKLPFAFTEHGIAMLSSVLNSEKAIQINIQIMNTFVKIRQFAVEHKDLTQRLQYVEKYILNYCKENDADKQRIYEAIDLLMDRTKPSKVGFIK